MNLESYYAKKAKNEEAFKEKDGAKKAAKFHAPDSTICERCINMIRVPNVCGCSLPDRAVPEKGAEYYETLNNSGFCYVVTSCPRFIEGYPPLLFDNINYEGASALAEAIVDQAIKDFKVDIKHLHKGNGVYSTGYNGQLSNRATDAARILKWLDDGSGGLIEDGTSKRIAEHLREYALEILGEFAMELRI